jgi:hypothetical protein
LPDFSDLSSLYSPTIFPPPGIQQAEPFHQTGVTIDYLRQLHMRGQYESVAEIGGRLVTDGDKRMTRELALHLHKNGFSQPLGEVVPLAQAFPNGIEDVSLQTARAGSVFDPANPIAAKNFSIGMPDGSYVPMLGHEAFGGKVNRFGMGEFSANTAGRFAYCNQGPFSPAKPNTLTRAGDPNHPPGVLARFPALLDSMSCLYDWLPILAMAA